MELVPVNNPLNTENSAFLSHLMGVAFNPVYATADSVGGLPAVGRAVEMVSAAVAAMLSSAQVFDINDNEQDAPSIVTRPNMLYTAVEFWEQVVRSLIMRGNFIGIKADFDDMGNARQIVPIPIDQVHVDLSSGIPVYKSGDHEWDYDEVIHIRRHTPVGSLWGLGVVERYRTALEGQLHEQAYGKNSFASGAVPSAVIQLDQANVTAETARNVQEAWVERHGSGERKPAVIGKAMSITPLSWSPHDAEFIESRKLSIAEAALMVGIDPSDLTASIGGSSLTYANLSARQLARITDSYAPWMAAIEQAWSDLLPGRLWVRGRTEALLRSSTSERYALHAVAGDPEKGWLTKNEIRAIEKLAPLDEINISAIGEANATEPNE